MQLSQTAEYALRAVVWLAENTGNPQTAQQIADGCRMPAGYLAKVLQPLAKAGVVSAQRGLGGGYVLEREAMGLSLLEVISAVEPVQRIRSCPLKIGSHGSKLCALHQTLDDALATVEDALGSHTVGELLSRETGVKPLCETVSATLTLGISKKKGTVGREGSGHGSGSGGIAPPGGDNVKSQ
jgi:Rrf2 family protein